MNEQEIEEKIKKITRKRCENGKLKNPKDGRIYCYDDREGKKNE